MGKVKQSWKKLMFTAGLIKSQRVALQQMMKRNCLVLAVENFMEKNPSNTGITGIHVIYAVYGHVYIVCLAILICPRNIGPLNVSSDIYKFLLCLYLLPVAISCYVKRTYFHYKNEQCLLVLYLGRNMILPILPWCQGMKRDKTAVKIVVKLNTPYICNICDCDIVCVNLLEYICENNPCKPVMLSTLGGVCIVSCYCGRCLRIN